MKTVKFEEVSCIFHGKFCDSEGGLFHSIAWDCLDKAGLTTYSNEKERAYIHLYAYAIQQLCEEFGFVAYEEPQDEPELLDQEPLTGAGIAALYRDLVADDEKVTEEDLEDMSESSMLAELVAGVQESVECAIFDQLGSKLTAALLYYSVQGVPGDCGDDDDEYDEYDVLDGCKRFHTKEALLEYCKGPNQDFLFYLSDYCAMQTMLWISQH